MKSSLVASVLVAVVLVVGIAAYALLASPGVPTGPSVSSTSSSTSSSTIVQSTVNQALPGNLDYICQRPAVISQYNCEQLPAGYQIKPRALAGIQVTCPSLMTQSACALLKQTYSNGVCDPNETFWTSPVDCSCSGALLADPYTGRCSLPATVCQLNGGG